MKEVLVYIINKIVPDPSNIIIEENITESGDIEFSIKAPEEYRGLIIGKDGKNILSIKNIVSIIAKRENKRVFIKIVD